MPEALPIAKGSEVCCLLPRMANRHGLIAGATGTGKTVVMRKNPKITKIANSA